MAVPRHKQDSYINQLAENQPLPASGRDLLRRLIDKGSMTIGQKVAGFGRRMFDREAISDCTPSQARGLVVRGYAVASRPDPRGPKVLKPLPAAYKLALSVILCLLVCSCADKGESSQPEAVKSTSQATLDRQQHQVIEVKAAGVTHHVLVVQLGTNGGVAVTKLCTTFDYDGQPYFVDSDGDIYEWTRIDRKRE